MKTVAAFAAVVAASCVLAACYRGSDFAELECTAHVGQHGVGGQGRLWL